MRANDFGALLLRVILGIIFIVHGLAKFQDGIGKTTTRFEDYNIPYAELVAMGVSGTELIGGIFMVIGFSIRFIAFLFAVIMIGAIYTVKFKLGFIHGYEFDLALMAISIYFLFAGGCMFALDNLFTEVKKKK